MPRHEELIGQFERERNVFGEGEDRLIIGTLDDGTTVRGDGTTVRGKAEEFALEYGLTYRFYGHWTNHPRYGKQFAFDSFIVSVPAGQRGVTKYLERARGIGVRRAKLIWEAFGSTSLEAIRAEPDKVAAAVPGLTVEVCRVAAEQFERDKATEATTIELVELIGGRGFPKKLIAELIDRFGARAAGAIRENAYVLMSFRGVGFLRADKLYLELGCPADAIERQGRCAWHALHSDQEGNTWYPVSHCEEAINRNVSGAKVDTTAAVEWAIAENLIVRREQDGKTYLAEAGKAGAESRLANFLHGLRLEPAAWPKLEPAAEGEKGPTSHQCDEYAKATAGPVGILAGSPGTGKTFTLASAIKAIGNRRIGVAAPTGKAAVRATESLAKEHVNLQATTIHRMLGVVSADGGDWEFEHDESNPLDFDFIFIDECFSAGTMVDTPIGKRVIESLKAGDEIWNASGVDKIAAIKQTEVHHAVHVYFGKKKICCSENHPFLTTRGWVVAGKLGPGDCLVFTTKAVRLLRNEHSAAKQGDPSSAILQSLLQCKMVASVPRVQGEKIHQGVGSEDGSRPQAIPEFRESRSRKADSTDQRVESSNQTGSAGKNIRDNEGSRSSTDATGREWSRANSSSGETTCDLEVRLGGGISDSHEDPTGQRVSNLLQTRLRQQVVRSGNRNQWSIPQQSEAAGTGCKKEEPASVARVDRIELLESNDSRLDQLRDADGKLRFYDIQAARHPSFSVEGVLVHNCSMLDTSLAANFFAAVPPGCHVLLVGDPDQLSPVGHGAPLRDLIAVGLPCGHLKEIQRNAGRIVKACAEIRDHKTLTTSPRLELPEENLLLIEKGQPKQQIDQLKALLASIGQGDTYDPVWDVQILVAVNDKSPLGRKPMNAVLQLLLNANGTTVDGSPFKVGDKIINLKNAFMPPAHDAAVKKLEKRIGGRVNETTNAFGKVFAANGEIGRVEEVAAKFCAARLWGPDRLVVIPRGEAKNGDGNGGDEKTDTGCSWDLAYAITSHKSQGSEFPIVIIMLDSYAGAVRLVDRHHLYTGISRAKDMCVMIGRKSVAIEAIGKSHMWKRRTFLREQIEELAAAGVGRLWEQDLELIHGCCN